VATIRLNSDKTPMLRRALLAYHSARHMKPAQLARRLWAELRRRLGLSHWTRLPAVPSGLVGRLDPAAEFLNWEPWNDRGALLAGRFRFLRHEVALGWPPDWSAADLPALWRYNLHYFAWLHLLGPDERLAVCRDWVRRNPVGRTIGWHPYPTSLRIVHWCKAAVDAPELLASLYQQAAYLYRHLELYHPGNHLLENAKALVFAGRYLKQGEAAAWVRRGLGLLRKEVPIQVLDDGGYFERSPMYHALMLEGFLDLMNVLPPPDPDRAMLADAAGRMSDFLVSLTHPDGQIALFNDSTQEIAPPTAKLVEYTHRLSGHEPQCKHEFPETGFFVHRRPGVYLVIDGGPVGPDYLPAHAHADIFSFELSVGCQPVVVDTGVYQYAAGPMRELVRKTSAHNTLSVDGVDQAECWHSFQVGRRYRPRDVTFELDGDRACFGGTFDGYARLIGDRIRHRRTITSDAARRTLEVSDLVEGRGAHTAESRLHFHPDLEVSEEPGGFVFAGAGVRGRVAIEDGQPSRSTGWYCPAFGLRRENTVLVLRAEGPLPLRIRYTLRYD